MPDCLIAFGSNEGNRQEVFIAAIERLKQTKGLQVTAASAPRLTTAVGGPEKQANYLNAAIRLATSLDPIELHQRIVEIETELGRTRRTRWGSRTIDLDLLLYGSEQIKSEKLTVPHPRMSFRRFVLEPACQIAGEMVHPPSGLTLSQLVSRLNDACDLVLCVCDHAFEKVILSIQAEVSEISGSNWNLQLAKRLGEFREHEEKAKLVTYFQTLPAVDGDFRGEPFQQLQSAARSFSGPTLELPRDKTQIQQEILAAVEAMTPLR